MNKGEVTDVIQKELRAELFCNDSELVFVALQIHFEF